MSRRWMRQGIVSVLLMGAGLLAVSAVLQTAPAVAQQDELIRKVKYRVAPVYPDIARRMNITGVVKVSVVVAPNGSLKSSKVVGGHPLLASAALDALKKWKFEPAADESTGIVEFRFQTQEQ